MFANRRLVVLIFAVGIWMSAAANTDPGRSPDLFPMHVVHGRTSTERIELTTNGRLSRPLQAGEIVVFWEEPSFAFQYGPSSPSPVSVVVDRDALCGSLTTSYAYSSTSGGLGSSQLESTEDNDQLTATSGSDLVTEEHTSTATTSDVDFEGLDIDHDLATMIVDGTEKFVTQFIDHYGSLDQLMQSASISEFVAFLQITGYSNESIQALLEYLKLNGITEDSLLLKLLEETKLDSIIELRILNSSKVDHSLRSDDDSASLETSTSSGMPAVVAILTTPCKAINPGELLVYTLTIKNSGRIRASDVVVFQHIPDGVSFDDPSEFLTFEGIESMLPEGTSYWKIGTLMPGEEEVCTFSLEVHQEQKESDSVDFWEFDSE